MHRRWEDAMTLKILPHGRLHEWVAEEQGYFAAEGLEYTFLPEGHQGPPNERLDAFLDRQVPAATLFGSRCTSRRPSGSARSSTPRS
jgi:hypothetical protein